MLFTSRTTYKSAGVDIDLDEICKGIMIKACAGTFKNNRHAQVLNLADDELHRIQVLKIGGQYYIISSDGVGTKIEIAERIGDHTTVAYDLVAMLVDDAVRFGAKPIAMTNVLDVASLDEKIMKQLAKGLANAAREAGIIVPNGEIAQLGKRVGGHIPAAYNWSGTLLSTVDPGKAITGEKIKPGDTILALREYGFRSNGLSLVRKIAREHHGDNWHDSTHPIANETLGRLVLRPSTIYAPAILAALENPDNGITGIAHITGGAIKGKLGRVLAPTGLGAKLDNLWAPPTIMKYFHKIGKVEDEEAYRTWNMGNGMLIITSNPKAVKQAIKNSGDYHIRECGEVTKAPILRIKTYQDKQIKYDLRKAG